MAIRSLISRNGGCSFLKGSAGPAPDATIWFAIALAGAIAGCVPTPAGPEPEPRETVDVSLASIPPETKAMQDPDDAAIGDLEAGPQPTAPSAGSGDPVWANGFDGLIAGLDGELYEGYLPGTIEQVQGALRERGLYSGPVHGVLDAPTMTALYAFQDASYGLQRCGIPTPRTRRLLEQGSHT